MAKNKIIKLSIIRDNEHEKCPFGIDIPFGCENAGELISRMAPLTTLGEDASEEEKAKIAAANNKLLMWNAPKTRCVYAGKLFKNKNVVECNFGSNAPGITEKEILGSPFYSKVYNNVALDGLYSYPLGYYGDQNISRNLYYGIYSLLGSSSEENINKFAEYLYNLNGIFDKLPEHEVNILVEFAKTYANNNAFIKKGNSANLDKISVILECWTQGFSHEFK